MGKILVLAEKPSVGRDIAKVLGSKNEKNGYIEAKVCDNLGTRSFGYTC